VSWLRRYLIPVFAACITLAVGIALGGGPLQSAGADDSASLREDNQRLEDTLTGLESARVFDDAWTAALAPRVLDGRLADAQVTLVVLPGVSDDAVDDMRVAIEQAGGRAAAVVAVDADVLDPGKKTYVASVADSSLSGASGIDVPPETDVYARFGSLLARAYVGSSASGGAFDDVAVKVDAELRGAKLVRIAEEPLRRGSLVVVLGAGDSGDEAVTEAAQVIATELVVELARRADAVVVSTPPSGRVEGGLLDALSAGDDLAGLRVSTVNAGTTSGGLVSTVYALASALADEPGDFGVVDGKAVLPPGFASPSD